MLHGKHTSSRACLSRVSSKTFGFNRCDVSAHQACAPCGERRKSRWQRWLPRVKKVRFVPNTVRVQSFGWSFKLQEPHRGETVATKTWGHKTQGATGWYRCPWRVVVDSESSPLGMQILVKNCLTVRKGLPLGQGIEDCYGTRLDPLSVNHFAGMRFLWLFGVPGSMQ